MKLAFCMSVGEIFQGLAWSKCVSLKDKTVMSVGQASKFSSQPVHSSMSDEMGQDLVSGNLLGVRVTQDSPRWKLSQPSV